MHMGNFKEYNQKQGALMMLVPDGLLEPEHPARIVDKVVELLDLSKIIDYYSDEGSAAYYPGMMIKVLFYGYQQGIFSGRSLENNLKLRADFIFLSGGDVPDFRTINLFRVRHKEALVDIFAQIVLLCEKLGMIDFKNLAVDGQKIHANANFRNNYNKDRLEKSLQKIKNGISKLLEKEINDDFSQEVKNKRHEKLKKKEKELKKLQEELEAILKNNKDENISLNKTDRDAKIMKHKDRKIVPSYNHQSAVDGKYGVTTAVQTTQANDCSKDLFSILEKSENNLESTHDKVLSDCGFCDYEALEKMETEREEDFYVPDKQHAQSKKKNVNQYKQDDFELRDNNYYCPNKKKMDKKSETVFDDGHSVTVYECKECSGCELKKNCTKGKTRTLRIDSREKYRKIMRAKLETDKGREIYIRRQNLCEAGHGNDQKNKGWKQHYLRGLSKASLEFMLIRIGSNLSKIAKYKPQELLAMSRT